MRGTFDLSIQVQDGDTLADIVAALDTAAASLKSAHAATVVPADRLRNDIHDDNSRLVGEWIFSEYRTINVLKGEV